MALDLDATEGRTVALVEETWTIGELAAAAGVTARTIRHYEAEGLLSPERTEAGHRRFDATAAGRLYEIVALRSVGLGLPEVRAVLTSDDSDEALRAIARRQLADLDEREQATRTLRSRLEELAATDPPTPTLALEATAMTIALDRITTRQGDDGTTSLAGTGRLAKDDARVEALGAIDELNAQLGLAVWHHDARATHRAALVEAQHRLFDIGGALARPESPAEVVTDDDVRALEAVIEALVAEQAPLTSFVLPGGGPYAAQLHATRTACRTAERRVVALAEGSGSAVRYLNRLSDLLFVLARDAAEDDVLWERRRPAV